MMHDYFTGQAIRQRITEGKAADGTVSETIDTSLTIYGFLRTLSKSIQYVNDKRTLYASHRWYCDPCDLVENDRLIVNGLEYQIANVNNIMDVGLLQVDLYRAS